jgi:hypothetical protein
VRSKVNGKGRGKAKKVANKSRVESCKKKSRIGKECTKEGKDHVRE